MLVSGCGAIQGLDVPIQAIVETEYGTVLEPDDIAKLAQSGYRRTVSRLSVADARYLS
jgi:hypothetical protein